MKPLIIILYERLASFIQDHLPSFVRGSLVAFVPSGIFLYSMPMLQVHFVVAYIIKAVGVGVMTFLSGIASSCSSDAVKWAKKKFADWKRKRRNRKFKQQNRRHE